MQAFQMVCYGSFLSDVILKRDVKTFFHLSILSILIQGAIHLTQTFFFSNTGHNCTEALEISGWIHAMRATQYSRHYLCDNFLLTQYWFLLFTVHLPHPLNSSSTLMHSWKSIKFPCRVLSNTLNFFFPYSTIKGSSSSSSSQQYLSPL